MKNILHEREKQPDISLGRKKSLSSAVKDSASLNSAQNKPPYTMKNGTQEDRELISRYFRERDGQALVDLLDKYDRYIVSIALPILKSPEDLKDLKQDLFIKMVTAFQKKDDTFYFKGWLGTVVRNYCIDRIRKDHRMTGDDNLPEPGEEDWGDLNLGMDFQPVRECVEMLMPDQRIYIELAFFKKMKNQAIAKQMDWTANKTRGTRDRALQKLKIYLGGLSDELGHYFQED